MITQLSLKFGSSVGQPPLSIDPAPITIFVGPNNSGKSILLREIDGLLENPSVQTIVLDRVQPQKVTIDEINQLVTARGQRNSPPGQRDVFSVQRLVPGRGHGPGTGAVSFEKSDTGQWELHDASNPQNHYRAASLMTVFLDGRTRLSLLDNSPTGNLNVPPQNHIAALFRDDDARRRIAVLTEQAFGEFLTIDAMPMTEFHVKMSPRAPLDVQEERGTDDRAIAFHREGHHISQYSDGVKAYIGLLAAVSSTVYKLVLIDEPEAFLHPPLARRLGRNIAELAGTQKACVVAATHDSDFLMGAIQASNGVNVVRLTYRGGVATARHLPAQTLSDLMRDPLLRSAGVIRSLFHAAVVVCEADADRAFYEEINERLISSGNDGVVDGLFMNVQNKQTVRRVVRPLREMGIPAAAIVDLDILKGTDLESLLQAAHVPAGHLASLLADHTKVQNEFGRCNASLDTDGLPLLDPAAQKSLDSFLLSLQKFGVFVVSVGELEKWLPTLGITGRKRDWLPQIFATMGSDPNSADYVRPATDDVWAFTRKIAVWTGDPNRAGIPT